MVPRSNSSAIALRVAAMLGRTPVGSVTLAIGLSPVCEMRDAGDWPGTEPPARLARLLVVPDDPSQGTPGRPRRDGELVRDPGARRGDQGVPLPLQAPPGRVVGRLGRNRLHDGGGRPGPDGGLR